MAAMLLTALLGLVALAFDSGYMVLVRTQLQTAADAGALASAADLYDEDAFADTARHYVDRNLDPDLPAGDPSVTPGNWNWTTKQFSPANPPFDAVEVSLQCGSPMFFGKVLGGSQFDAAARAVGVVRPRDIVLVLDFSGSMNEGGKINELKAAVDLFLDVLDDAGGIDRVAFVAYSTNASLVTGLTANYSSVNAAVQQMSADGWTNIGGGMQVARTELNSHARPEALKMMVVMTDGQVNRPTNVDPRAFVIQQAESATAEKIDLVTVSFGAGADQALMSQVANIGQGVHFYVEAGIEDSEADLRAVFFRIATRRPTLLMN
jgi:uncharacterized protein YegL